METKPKYYHGGYGKLAEGDFILPPSETGARCCSDYGASKVHRRDRVYLATDVRDAALVARLVPGGAVYECEPIGEVEDDPDALKPGISYACPRALILRRIW